MDPQTERRIAQFKAVGGVEFVPEDKALEALVHIGVAEHRQVVFTFQCPLCSRIERNNQDMEPMCTGPAWTNDHEPTIMVRQP